MRKTKNVPKHQPVIIFISMVINDIAPVLFDESPNPEPNDQTHQTSWPNFNALQRKQKSCWIGLGSPFVEYIYIYMYIYIYIYPPLIKHGVLENGP